jgi:alanine racemase
MASASSQSRDGSSKFFVATLEEGIELRRAVNGARIYVLNGVSDGEEDRFVVNSLTPVLNSVTEAERWAPTNRRVALQIDTGMSRLGLSLADVDILAARRDLIDALHIEYVLTHLACADESSHPLNAAQLKRFDLARRRLPITRTSIGSTAGIFLGPEHCGDMARAGIGLYGGNPFVDRPNPMKTVARLRGRVMALRRAETDATVGYGATYTVSPGKRLAVIGVGYADGYPRQLSNRGVASFNGSRLPVVGRVSMDSLVVDATAVTDGAIGVGDYVELMGGDIGVDELATACGTISYEIFTGLGRRLHRIYAD